MGFRFADPWFGCLFLIFPVLIGFLWRRGRPHARPLSYDFSSLDSLNRFKARSFRERFHGIDRVLWFLGLSLLILGMMRPQFGKEVVETNQDGIAIMLALDTSRSMAALDFKRGDDRVNRLEIEKDVLGKFIEGRVNDQMGMVIFGELAFTQSPLTTDRTMLLNMLRRAKISMAGDGTAIGDGLALAVKRLQKSKAKSKVIILVTDGENTAGRLSPTQGAEFARDLGIKVYTIGIGSQGQVPFPDETPWGTRIVMVDFEIDEATLTQIAETTGGKYWNAKNTEELREIYATIDQLEKSEIHKKSYSQYRELYGYFVIPACFMLFLFPWVRLGVMKRWIGF